MNNTVALNGLTAAASHADKRELQLLMKLLKKYNLKKTEDTLCQEANVRLDTLDDANERDLSAALSAVLNDTHDYRNGNTAGAAASSGAEPSVFDQAYGKLCEFVEESLDIYKHELSMVLYPILVQIYFKLIEHGHTLKARQFVEKYGPDLNNYYRENLQNMLHIKRPSDLKNNDFVTAMETDKFIIRMSRDSHSLFKRHIQDRKQEEIAEIVSKYLHFDTYEGTARSKAQCDATAGASIGEARRQDNKTRVYYGLPKDMDLLSLTTPAPVAEEEEDNDPDAPDKPKKKKPKRDPLFSKKSKSDPNAPAHDRIPLPVMRDADKWEKLKALRESAKRQALSRDKLPSVCMYTVLNSNNNVICAEFTDDSSIMALGMDNSTIRVYSVNPNSKLRSMKTADQLKDIDKDAEDVLVRMMDDRNGEAMRILHGHCGPVFRCSFAPEKVMMLSCSEDGTIRLWSLHTWTCIVVYKGHLFPVWDVRFSPHGYYFASASYDKTVKLWATDFNQPLRVFCGHLADVDCVQFHPNSNYIASGSSDRTVRLWDVLTGHMVRLMTGHKGPIYALAFSTCGRYLASGAADHQVLVWDLSHGQLITSLRRHSGPIHTVTFSRDGSNLSCGGLDCLLTMWDFSKLIEDYLSHNPSNSSHNPDVNNSETYLLRAFPTKSTPFLTCHFTRRNLLLGVGFFKS